MWSTTGAGSALEPQRRTYLHRKSFRNDLRAPLRFNSAHIAILEHGEGLCHALGGMDLAERSQQDPSDL